MTGAGRGIGKAIALAYAQAGAAVGCAARTETEIEQTKREIEQAGGQGLAIQADVADPQAVANMVQKTVAAFSRLDILVINAGVNADRHTVTDSQIEGWLWSGPINISF